MNRKRWIAASLCAFAAVTLLEMFAHGVVLGGAYRATASVWRPIEAMNRLLPLGMLSTLIASFVLYYIYHRGYEGRGGRLAEGLRFGLVMGLFTAVPMAAWSYATIPMTGTIAIGWFAIGMVDMLVAGAIIALIHRPAG